MFFQVKSNDGTQIAIRPFAIDGAGANYTLMQALSAAGLSAQPEYLSMVDRMMEEQMPIDRESLQQMARLVNANPRIDVQTLVQMQKLGIPITVENASQFENYMNDSQAITRELDALIEQFPQSLTGTEGTPVKTETMRQLGNELLQILTDGLEEVPQQIQSPEPDMAYNLDGLNYESVQTDTAETQMQMEAAPETATETVQEHPEILSQQEGQAAAEERRGRTAGSRNDGNCFRKNNLYRADVADSTYTGSCTFTGTVAAFKPDDRRYSRKAAECI